MTGSQRERQPRTCYEFRIRGHLGATTLRVFPALHAAKQGQDTLLRGVVADRAALHEVLAEVEALGLELRRLPGEPDTGRITRTYDVGSPGRA